MLYRILRLDQVLDRTGLSRSTIYHYISIGAFPKQVMLGGGTSGRAVGWIESEVEEWIARQIEISRRQIA